MPLSSFKQVNRQSQKAAFSSCAPEASKRAGESFSLLIGFIARELGRTGMRPSLALSTARGAVSEWQGGMMLAFAAEGCDGSFGKLSPHGADAFVTPDLGFDPRV